MSEHKATFKRRNNKIPDFKGNVQNCNADKNDKIKQSTERLTEYCHTTDLVQAFPEENELNKVFTTDQTSQLYNYENF